MKNKLILKSSFISLTAQIINAVISFVTRTIFVHTLGVSVLGVNGVISNLLGMLSLAELGFGTAITQSLYKPFIDNDTKKISSIMKLYKIIYRYIGLVVFMLGIISMFFLKFVIKDTDLETNYIHTIYLFQLISIVSTYFFSYKRTMLYVDQKQYLTILYDLIVNIFMSIVRIIVLLKYKNYILFLSVQVLQNIISNIVISNKVNKMYPYINDKNIEKYEDTKKLFSNIKDIVFGKIAGYVYGSTDNLIISSNLGVNYVGKLSNYTMISSLVKTFLNSIVSPIQAIYANFLHSNTDSKKLIFMIDVYTFSNYIMICVFVIPFIILSQSFVEFWIGREYILSNYVVILISVDIIMHIFPGPLGNFVTIMGFFKEEKKMYIVGTIINLLISIISVQFIGLEGVLLGTAITQFFFWIGRGYYTFSNNIINISSYALSYIFDILKYLCCLFLNIFLSKYFVELFIINKDSLFQIIISSIICIIIPCIVNIIIFRKNKNFKYLCSMFIIKRNL